MAQTLKFGNGTWATKKGSTLAFNDEGGNFKPLPFTTTRATSATRVNKEGLIEVVEGDRPRIDYTDTSDGVLLLEKAATNLIAYSEDFSDASWLKNQATVAITSDIAPDGTTNSVYNYVGNNSNLYTTSQASGLEYTISFYLKSNGQGADDFRLRLGNSFSNTMTATTEWKRYSFTSTAATSVFSLTSNGINDVNLLVWGAMLEQNSFVTSYIPTNGSSVTRQADTASGAGNSEVFSDSEGVLMFEGSFVNDTSFKGISISSGANANSIRIYKSNVDNQIVFRVRVGDVDQFLETIVLSNTSMYNKISLKYKENDYSAWVNGFEVATELSGSVFSSGILNTLDLSNAVGGDNFYGKTKELAYYNTILTDAELETLTSYRSLSELVTELNLNTL